jgi:hypothetical protein
VAGDPNSPAFEDLNNTFVDGWFTDSLVTCTDCHDNSDASGPRGPHGSAYKWLFKKADPNVKVTTKGGIRYTNESTWGSTPPTSVTAPENFCTNCHRGDVYGLSSDSGFSFGDRDAALFSRFNHEDNTDDICLQTNAYSGRGTKWPIGCMNCHGGNEPGGIHGSARGIGPKGNDPVGKHFTNGSSWNGHTLGEASGTQGACFNKGAADAVNTCTKHSRAKTYTPTYYYTMPEP